MDGTLRLMEPPLYVTDLHGSLTGYNRPLRRLKNCRRTSSLMAVICYPSLGLKILLAYRPVIFHELKDHFSKFQSAGNLYLFQPGNDDLASRGASGQSSKRIGEDRRGLSIFFLRAPGKRAGLCRNQYTPLPAGPFPDFDSTGRRKCNFFGTGFILYYVLYELQGILSGKPQSHRAGPLRLKEGQK